MELYTEKGSLSAKLPFSLAKSLNFLDIFIPMRDEQELSGGMLTKAIRIQNQVVAFQVKDYGDETGSRLEYTLFSKQPLETSVKAAVVDRISFFLSLDDDLKPFYDIAYNDPAFAPIIDQLYGLHHVKFLTLFESSCWSVLAQHIPLAVSRKMKRTLIERFGSSIEVNGQVYWAFPEQEQLADVSVEEFTLLLKNSKRAEYLAGVVQAFKNADENFLRTAPYAEAEAWLRRIKGIGEWSAAFILLRGLGRMEQMPFSLKPILSAIEKVYGPGETIEKIAARYGPHLGYWAFYLRVAD
jgi:DNA-3-methyladenine glycosylase II